MPALDATTPYCLHHQCWTCFPLTNMLAYQRSHGERCTCITTVHLRTCARHSIPRLWEELDESRHDGGVSCLCLEPCVVCVARETHWMSGVCGAIKRVVDLIGLGVAAVANTVATGRDAVDLLWCVEFPKHVRASRRRCTWTPRSSSIKAWRFRP